MRGPRFVRNFPLFNTNESELKTNGYRIAKDAPLPSPDHSPEQVIGLILDALQHNDTPYQNAGIEVSLSFSSPSFRPIGGSSEDFMEMVKRSMYSPLLNFQHASRDPIQVTGHRAEQRVTIRDEEGSETVFVWMLRRQSNSPYTGCWMTEGVLREE